MLNWSNHRTLKRNKYKRRSVYVCTYNIYMQIRLLIAIPRDWLIREVQQRSKLLLYCSQTRTRICADVINSRGSNVTYNVKLVIVWEMCVNQLRLPIWANKYCSITKPGEFYLNHETIKNFAHEKNNMIQLPTHKKKYARYGICVVNQISEFLQL